MNMVEMALHRTQYSEYKKETRRFHSRANTIKACSDQFKNSQSFKILSGSSMAINVSIAFNNLRPLSVT